MPELLSDTHPLATYFHLLDDVEMFFHDPMLDVCAYHSLIDFPIHVPLTKISYQIIPRHSGLYYHILHYLIASLHPFRALFIIVF